MGLIPGWGTNTPRTVGQLSLFDATREGLHAAMKTQHSQNTGNKRQRMTGKRKVKESEQRGQCSPGNKCKKRMHLRA